MKRKGVYVCIIWLFLCVSIPMVKAEERIVIDGNFSDWEALQLEYTELKDPFKSATAYVEEDALYLHVIGRYHGTTVGGLSISITQADGTVKRLELQNGSNEFDLIVKDSDYHEIAGAVGSGSLYQNVRTWEMQIPQSWCNDPVSITIQNMTFPVNKKAEETPDVEEPVKPEDELPDGNQPENSEGETPDVDDSKDNNDDDEQGGSVDSGIIIDGYFDDWMNLPHTEIDWENGVISNGTAVRKDDQIYVHVGNPFYDENRHLNLDNIVISINDQRYHDLQIKLRIIDNQGNISTEPLWDIKQNHRYKMVAVINHNGKNYVLGDAYYATKKAHNREDFEFCMDLDVLAEALHVKLDTKDTITISFPSIGNGSISIEGTSSGPWIIVGLCGVVALGGIYISKKKPNK